MNYDRFESMKDIVVRGAGSRGEPFQVGIIAGKADFSLFGILRGPVREGWLRPVFYGNETVLDDGLRKAGLEATDCIIVDAVDREARAIAILEAARSGGLEAICIAPDAAVRNFPVLLERKEDFFPVKEQGCGISALEMPGYPRLLFVADTMSRPSPGIDQKVEIVDHLVRTARSCGVEHPRVALLAAVEVVNRGMPVTVEAQLAARRSARADADVEGPVSMDLAVNMNAVKKKGFSGQVPGRADCLVGPTLTVSRSIYHAASALCGARVGSIFAGGRVPVALPGRTDGAEGLLLSILMALAASPGGSYDA